MLTNQQRRILELVKEADCITAKSLAEDLGISDRSVRKRVQELNDILKENGIAILAKARYGYYMEPLDKERLPSFLEERDIHGGLPDTAEERVQYLTAYLLDLDGYAKMEDLADMLCVSRGTLAAALKQTEELFARYGITIERRPNYGIRAVGTEFDRRMLLMDVYIQNTFLHKRSRERQQEGLKEISRIVRAQVEKYGVRLSETAFAKYVDYIYVTLQRIRDGHPVTVEIDRNRDYVEKKDYYVVEGIVKDLEERFSPSFSEGEKQPGPATFEDEKQSGPAASEDEKHPGPATSEGEKQPGPATSEDEKQPGLVFSEDERLAMALQLIGKNTKGDRVHNNLVIPPRIDEIVVRLLAAVSAEFHLDFTKNLDLRLSLCQHMLPMDIRIRYGIPIENPMLSDIRAAYQLPHTIAEYAAHFLEREYGTAIAPEETGFLALIFALALEKRENVRKNILLVCSSGRGSAQLLQYKFQNEFAPYIEKLYTCSVYELGTFDFGTVDYVITTIPLTAKIPVPILQIHEFMTGEDIVQVRVLLDSSTESVIRGYFREEYFFPDLQGTTKEEILKEMCARMNAVSPVPAGLYDSVMEREGLSSTDFGNLTALPHPNELMTEETFMAVGIAPKPVFWGRGPVQLVFFAMISAGEDENLQKLYEMTIKAASDEESVNRVIRTRSYEDLIKVLGSV